jgi:hypothetical protein
MFVQLQKSLMIYHRKNRGHAAALLVKAIYVLSNSVRMVAWFVLSVVNRDPLTRRRSAAAKAALVYHFIGVEPE